MGSSNTLFSMTLPLCKIVQSVSCDLIEAVQHTETRLNQIINLNENIDNTFDEICLKNLNSI